MQVTTAGRINPNPKISLFIPIQARSLMRPRKYNDPDAGRLLLYHEPDMYGSA
jgi:hypothetical protein